VLWIGGTPCAGKTTVAQALAQRYTFHVYARDESVSRHSTILETCSPNSVCARLVSLTVDERWILRSAVAIAETSIAASRERFPLLVEDLLHLPSDSIVVVEGIGMDPDLVHPLLSDMHQAVWLIASEALTKSVWEGRRTHGSAAILGKVSDPVLAFNNLLQRNLYLTRYVEEMAGELGLYTVSLQSVDDIPSAISSVDAWFRCYLADRGASQI
jgi:hypothetical protein